jgi:hypothetical protein
MSHITVSGAAELGSLPKFSESVAAVIPSLQVRLSLRLSAQATECPVSRSRAAGTPGMAAAAFQFASLPVRPRP